MRAILFLKSSIKHKAGYALYGFPLRWHKITDQKPAPKGAPVAAHPQSAGAHMPIKHLTDAQWEDLKLPADNVNAPTFNKHLEKLKAMSEAGDVTGMLASGYGVNTYGKKLSIIANHLLGLHGVEHKVAPGQKPGEHAAVQTRPEPTMPIVGVPAWEYMQQGKGTVAGVGSAEAKKLAQDWLAANPGGEADLSSTLVDMGKLDVAKDLGIYKPPAPSGMSATEKGTIDKLVSDGDWEPLEYAVGKLGTYSPETLAYINEALKKKPVAHGVDFDALMLPDTNSNAPGINKKVAALKAAVESGDVAAVAAIKTGSNTYNKKIEAAKQQILASLGGAPAPVPAPKVAKVEAAKPSDPVIVHSFINASEGMTSYVHKHADNKWSVSLMDVDSGQMLPTINFYSTEGEAVVSAKKAVGVKDAPAPKPPRVAKVTASAATATKQVSAIELHNTQDGHNKTWSLSTYGSTIKTEYGKIGGTMQSTVKHFPNPGAAMVAAEALVKEKTGKGYQYAGQKTHTHEVTLQAGVPDAAPPPKKTVADVAIPDFGDDKWGLNYAKVAAALKAKIETEGKAGFGGGTCTFHKTGAKTGVITVKIAGFKVFASLNAHVAVRSQKLHAFITELQEAVGKAPPKVASVKPSGPKEGDTKMGADGMLVLKHGRWVKVDQDEPAAAAPAAPQSMAGWKQIGAQKGSNPGGLYESPEGQSYYVKFPADADHARSEVLAAALYTAVGIAAPETHLVSDGGKIGIASKWNPLLRHDVPALQGGAVADIKKGFAVDAWLANYDVAGQDFDNVMLDKDGKPVRIDVGASMEYRAQGKKKEFGPVVTETKSLLDPKINANTTAMFAGITPADITAGVAKIAAIDDEDIKSLVNLYGPGDEANKAKLAATLIARKYDLLEQYPKASKILKKKLNPTRLPVDANRLPKAHDFSNWNGAGKGLSSKDYVNAANAAVEQEMLALAKKGDLVALRGFGFKSLDKETGLATGKEHPISQHPSKHVVQLHEDLLTLLDEIANPPEPLKLFKATEVSSTEAIAKAFPPKPFGTTVGKVKSNEKIGFWVALGQISSIDKFKPKKTMDFTTAAISAAKQKYAEASKLAKHFIAGVQASGSYNTLFREGKKTDGSGKLLTDVAKAALEYATSQPEGTSVYRWQNMTDAMVQHVMKAPTGTVIQATGPMCTSYDPTATSGFGKHRVTIRYAKGAKAVESFGSGAFKSEKEITTLPNARFVVLSHHMVASHNGSQRLELELLMLPPDLGIAADKV